MTKPQKPLSRNTGSELLTGKLPPQALELEKAVLGAILLERGAIDRAVEIVTRADMFYDLRHQRIYEAMLTMYGKRMAIDLLTIVEHLRSTGDLQQIAEGPYYLTTLTNHVASSSHLEDHCRYIVERWMKRAMIGISSGLIADGYDEQVDAFELLDKAEREVFAIANSLSSQQETPTDQIAAKALNEVLAAKQNPADLIGAPTGYKLLDKVTCGWQAPDLIIIAARPSVGKTAFAMNLALNACFDAVKPTPTAFYNLEMSNVQVMKRALSSVSAVSLSRMLRGNISDSEVQAVQRAAERISNSGLHLHDKPAMNLYELRSSARRMVTQHGVGLIIIDYLQLMNGMTEGKKGMNREQEVSNISRGLKALAKELQVPIIALSQLSRESEKRNNGKFQLSDLRESGAIEQDADFVGFLSRDDYQQNDKEKDPALAGSTLLQIRKHRNGQLDEIPFRTDLDTQRFMNWEPRQEAPPGGHWVAVGQRVLPPEADEVTDHDLPF